MSSVRETIVRKLTEAFSPLELSVIDESDLHAGHAGSRPEGETHFRVTVVSPAFAGKLPIARHRMINEVLADELAGPVHALSISAEPPAA